MREPGIELPTVVTGHASGVPSDTLLDTPLDYATPYTAGALASTAEDLVTFWHALLAGEVLPVDVVHAAFAQMYPMQPLIPAPLGTQTYYGRGVQLTDTPGEEAGPGLMLEHSGGIVGFNAVVAYLVEDDVYIAVIVNDEDVPAAAGLWSLARALRTSRLEPSSGGGPPFALTMLRPLRRLCGSAERAPALGYLTGMIAFSGGCLWGLGFPFGFPLEVAGAWGEQLELVEGWGDDAYGLGLELVRRSEEGFGRKHLRRLTDLEHRAPHDPYHYRVIYQTFFGMRDVLAPLLRTPGTAVLPFRYRCLPTASRVVVEACPATTLDRLALPRRNYKRPQGGALTLKEKGVRREILRGLRAYVALSEHRRRVTAGDPGGDALAFGEADHRSIAAHPRYRLEGRHFA